MPETADLLKVQHAKHTADLMEEAVYYGFNLRFELRALIDSDPDLYDRMTLWLERIQSDLKARKAQKG